MIRYPELDPIKGSEQAGKRPVVIISGQAMNMTLQVVMTCPITSIIKQIRGCVVIEKNDMNNLKKNSEVLVLQLRTISKNRLSKKIGDISKSQIQLIKEGINLYLNY